MNAKKVKALRKKLGFHPTDPRSYEGSKVEKNVLQRAAEKYLGSSVGQKNGPRRLSKECSRYAYYEAKKLAHAGSKPKA